MEKIKILLAEDSKVKRDIFKRELVFFGLDNFELTICETDVKAIEMIKESDKSRNYYDILFVDIDFTEPSNLKRGQRDSGFKIIREAFKTFPLSKICTHSAHQYDPDLASETAELIKNGLIIKPFDTRKSDGSDWFKSNFQALLDQVNTEKYLIDVWKNHKAIIERFASIKGFPIFEAKANLDFVISLLQIKSHDISFDRILRMIIHFYHLCLELFVEFNKNDLKIFEDYNQNLEKGTLRYPFLKKHKKVVIDSLQKNQTPTSQQKLIAYSVDNYFRFGDKLNYYRNESIHPDNDFNPGISNILFANLTLMLYVNGKNGIYLENFENIPDLQKEQGYIDLQKLIEYCK